MQTPNPSSLPSTPGWRFMRRSLIGVAVVVTLIAAFYAEEDVRGPLAWKSYQREAARNGIQLDYSTFIPPRVPDDQNFAMTPFLAPLLDFERTPLAPGQIHWRDEAGHKRALEFATDLTVALDSVKNDHNDPQEHFTDLVDIARALQKKSKSPSGVAINTRAEAAGEVIRDLDQYKPVIDELREAGKRPAARFNIGYDDADPAGILLPHLAVLRNVARVLTYQASSELALGRKDAAFADLNLIISVAESIRNESIMIDQLVRIVIMEQARQITWEGLATRAWNDQQLRELQGRFEKVTMLEGIDKSLHFEQAMHGTRLFDFMRGHPKEFVSVFAGDKGMDSAWSVYPEIMRFGPVGWTYLEQVSYNQIYTSQFEGGFDSAKAQVHPSVLAANQRKTKAYLSLNIVSSIVGHRFMSAMLIPALGGLWQRGAYSQALLDECALACALERFRMANGQFPGSLGALSPQYIATLPNDVITGDPFKYRPNGDSQFILYSVGWNEKDDDGTIVMKKNSTTPDLTQGDWAWQPYLGK